MSNKRIKDSLVESYNRQAEQRNRGSFEDWKAQERARFLTFLQQEHKVAILELGAGHGRDSLFFQEQGFKVIAIDLSPVMTGLCREKGITAIVMDMVELGFKDNSFDAVYALNSFLHVPKQEFLYALENVRRVLRPAGLYYLGLYGSHDFEGVWEQDSYTPKRFFSLYTTESLRKILGDVFEIVYFRKIELGQDNLPFQSVILRKKGNK